VLERARAARAAGDLKLACHLVDFVRKGDPQNKEGWELWRDVFNERAAQERSLMARGAFRYAVRMAEAKLKALGD
jgi:alkyl sulfatase BDS1-like metallo-beta-lactamase superfamily hydrolase